MRPNHKAERGFAIVTAIFILVVLAALGGFMVTIATSQQIGSALDVQGVRAYQAAKAGLEWGIYKRQRDGMACVTGAGTTNSFALPAGATTLSGFRVTVVCTQYADPPITGGPAVYQIESTACNFPSGGACPGTVGATNYVERRVKVTF